MVIKETKIPIDPLLVIEERIEKLEGTIRRTEADLWEYIQELTKQLETLKIRGL